LVEETLGEMTPQHLKLVTILDFVRPEQFIKSYGNSVGRPCQDRVSIVCAFIAKATLNLSTTRALIDRLKCDVVLRRDMWLGA
jgi:hypothetical protein